MPFDFTPEWARMRQFGANKTALSFRRAKKNAAERHDEVTSTAFGSGRSPGCVPKARCEDKPPSFINYRVTSPKSTDWRKGTEQRKRSE